MVSSSALVVLAIALCAASQATADGNLPLSSDLTGKGWQITNGNGSMTVDGSVPGYALEALQAAGKVGNPLERCAQSVLVLLIAPVVPNAGLPGACYLMTTPGLSHFPPHLGPWLPSLCCMSCVGGRTHVCPSFQLQREALCVSSARCNSIIHYYKRHRDGTRVLSVQVQ